jgi:hypothetical protein
MIIELQRENYITSFFAERLPLELEKNAGVLGMIGWYVYVTVERV